MPIELTATEALGLWHRVSLEEVRGEASDLTLRQMAILLQIGRISPNGRRLSIGIFSSCWQKDT